jgi:transposase-like protein
MGAPKVAVTKKHALAALKRCSWNQVHAARELQMSRHTLVDWVREFRASGVAVPAWQRVPGVVGGNPEEQLKSERAKVRALEDRIARLQRLGPRQAPRPSARKRV